MDITTILRQTPLSTTPSLEAGDPVRNALAALAVQLKHIQKLEIEHHLTSSSRVMTPILPKQIDPPEFPRVKHRINPPLYHLFLHRRGCTNLDQ